MNKVAYRAGAGLCAVTAIFLVWSWGALGVIGSEEHPANRMLAGVLATLILGVCGSRSDARRLSCVLVATATVQVLVAVMADGYGDHDRGDTWMVTGLFTSMWLASAWAFRKAARPPVARGP